MMTLKEAIEELDKLPLKDRLNSTDLMALAELLRQSVNEAFEIGRLDQRVIG